MCFGFLSDCALLGAKTPSLPGACPDFRPLRCGGRKSNFLADGDAEYERFVLEQSSKPAPGTVVEDGALVDAKRASASGRPLTAEQDALLKAEQRRVSAASTARAKEQEAETVAQAASKGAAAKTAADAGAKRKADADRARFLMPFAGKDDAYVLAYAKDSHAIFPEGATREQVLEALLTAVGLGAPVPSPEPSPES
jgi:hypothetical protein